MSGQLFNIESTKVCIFIIVEAGLMEELARINKLIAMIDHKNYPIENNFYISLRLIEEHEYTRSDLWELAKKIKIATFINSPFQFNQSDNLYIDEEKDILLDLNVDESFYSLRKSIMEIKSPGKSTCSPPHITSYYQVENEKAAHIFLQRLRLNSIKKFSASTVGLGLLGNNYNLLKTLYTYPLNMHLNHSLPYTSSHFRRDNIHDDLLLP